MGVCEVNQTIQYLDGLGRPIQTVGVKASPLGNDIVQPVAYDQYGRETTKYLPYVTPGTNNGAYRGAAITEQSTYYNPTNSSTLIEQANGIVNTPYPYAVTNFEPSPLNRVVEQGAPGAAWQLVANSTLGHTVKTIYTTNNSTSFASDSINGNQVSLYEVTINSDYSRTLTNNGYYAPGTLYVTVNQDENWHTGRAGTVEEYKDFEGHVVLKRVYNYTGSPATVQVLSTYYVYDDLGNLCYVLPPGSTPDNMTMVQSTYDNLCYQYWYDYRNRLFRKKLPGKGWEFTIYNSLDQVTFTQDANQRNKTPQVWTFMQYDALGRVALTGIWSSQGVPGINGADNNISAPNTALFQWLTSWQNGQTQLWITRDNSTATGYVAANPQGGQYLKINYYDDYAFPGQPAPFTTPTGASVMTRGLLTGTKTMVLNTINNPTPDMLTDVHYYDGLGRETQTYKQHYFGGSLSQYNYDQINNTYDFANELTNSTRQHFVTNSNNTAATSSVTVANTYVYDHEGQRKQTWEQIGGGANVLLIDDEYNEIGQLLTKNLYGLNGGGQGANANVTLNSANAITSGNLSVTATNSIIMNPGFSVISGATFTASISGYLQTVAYTYNERGWMLSNTAQLFQEQLQYNNISNVSTSTPIAQYNGNIAAATWGTQASPNTNGYVYNYNNKINRLSGGINPFTGNNERPITYDSEGNIIALSRTIGLGNIIDNLTYNYTLNGNPSNQLQSVTDASTYAGPVGMPGGTTNYTYDNNGNELTQTNTANTVNNKSIVYNMLNLPQVVTLQTGTVTYTYDADGNKLRKVDLFGGNTTTEDYISGIQHTTGGPIDFIQTEEGRALNSGGAYHYEYSLTDHLGNERVSFDTYSGTAAQTQNDDYYPFGLDIPGSTIVSPQNYYLYNGKEQQPELGTYDYGWRQYDPVIARWNVLDPDAENYENTSSYAYVLNNPINLGDVDGRDTLKTVYIHATRTPKPKPEPEPIEPLKEIKPIEYGVFIKPPVFLMPVLTLVFVLMPANYDDHEEADNLRLMNARRDPKHPGSYTIKFKSGKRYHGKGSFARALQSAKFQADLHKDSFEISDIDWTPSTSNEQSFRDEAKRLEADGGKNNPNNYNQIDSPGSHKYKQDQ
ncbi:DUF6443 domain-containing protein [Mucilaginibacter sp. E4BP6]|uniref:DUF6443 domain-containing protein n=1 Tax=Mucilaginibacter sp. E4BP6 TaxID=2723089 RepID=UPI003977C56E